MKKGVITEADIIYWAAGTVKRQFEYSNDNSVIRFKIDPANAEVGPSLQRLALLSLHRQRGIVLNDWDKEKLEADTLNEFSAKVKIHNIVSILSDTTGINDEDEPVNTLVEITKEGFVFGKINYYPRNMRTKQAVDSFNRKKAKDKKGNYRFTTTLTDIAPNTPKKNTKDTIYHMVNMLRRKKIPLEISISDDRVVIRQH